MKPLMPSIGTADSLFHDGNPATGELGTIVSAEWLNNAQGCLQDLQREIIAALAAAQLAPDAATAGQLLSALQALFLGKTAQAADAAKLGGQAPSYYAKASDLAGAGSRPGRFVATFKDTPEPGTLVCNGAAVSRVTYAKLFAEIGTKYGAGDGSSTFNLPNIPDGFALLAANGSAVGSSTAGEVKSHSHTASSWTDTQGAHSHSIRGGLTDIDGGLVGGGRGAQAQTLTTEAGGAHTHNVGTTINAAGVANNLAAGMRLLICIAY